MKRVTESLLFILALVLSINLLSSNTNARSKQNASSLTVLGMTQGTPRTVVAVNLESNAFTIRELKYRVFFNKAEMKQIPLNDYDFRAAFADELLNALSADGRMTWRLQSTSENFDVPLVMKKKAQPPSLDAERILLVNIREYGAFLADLAKDKFYIYGQAKLIDRATGKKLWDYNVNERIDLDGKIAEMQADNQKGLKEGINRVLEKVCKKVAMDLQTARL
jgi:hypothetical protein